MKKFLYIFLFIVNFVFSQETETLTITGIPASTSTATPYSVLTRPSPQDAVQAYRLLGSNILCETAGQNLMVSNVATALTDNQIKFTVVVVPRNYTITGVQVYSAVAGSYTGDQNNKVGLYSYSSGSLTLVASSANAVQMWTVTANTIQSIAFSAPYSAIQGVYVVAILYNNSVQVTAPSLASGIALSNATKATPGLTNSAKLYSTLAAQNDLPASTTMSALTAALTPMWVALY